MSASLTNSAVAMEPGQGYELSITRTFDAPRELVWKAWTDPEMAKEWMGPRGFTATEFTTSSEEGGHWHLALRGWRPGSDQPVTVGQGGAILEIKPPELLKYTFAWDTRASVGLPESPYTENVITVRFEERGGKTVMHFHQAPFATESERDGHNVGWNSAFDCFAEFMLGAQPERVADPNDVPTELHLKRFFAAPRQMVFDAWTKPEMMEQWWGPRGFTTTIEHIEARQGGQIRFFMRGPEFERRWTARFVQFQPPYRLNLLAAIPDAEGAPMFESSSSVFFDEVEGGTMLYLDIQLTKSTPEAAFALKGMRQGWGQSLDRLAEFVNVRQERVDSRE